MADTHKENLPSLRGRPSVPIDRQIVRLALYMPLGLRRQFEGAAIDSGCSDKEIYTGFAVKVIEAGLAALQSRATDYPDLDHGVTDPAPDYDFNQIPAC